MALWMRLALFFTVSIFLAGCYVSDVKVISSGDWAPIPKKAVCKNSFAGAKTNMNVSEVSSGVPFFKSYEYLGDDNERILFKKISNGFYLAQVNPGKKDKNKTGAKYAFLYFKFINNDEFIVYIPDVMTRGGMFKRMMKDYNIHMKPSGRSGTLIKLYGSAGDIKSYLVNHDVGLLIPFHVCKRVKG